MNIGIDIDDTITDTYETLLPMIAVKYGMDLGKLMDRKLNYKALNAILPDYHNFVVENYHILARMVPLKKDVIEVLNKLRKEGNKIIFITARNIEEYKNPYKLSYDYLIKNKVPFDKLITNIKDKGKECINQGIDLFIDDNTLNCKAVKKYGIKTVQFDSGFACRDEDMIKVRTWNELYELVNNGSY
mgnify:CR=1 FL=1